MAGRVFELRGVIQSPSQQGGGSKVAAHPFRGSLAAIAFALLASAQAAEKKLERPDPDTLVLGETTIDQLVTQLGKPQTGHKSLENGIDVQSVTWERSKTDRSGHGQQFRSLATYWVGDRLIGYTYISSYDSELKTLLIDDGKVKQIAVGDTKARVKELLGPPTGEMMYPKVTPNGISQFIYAYMETSKASAVYGYRFVSKSVRITFDAQGRVEDIATSEFVPR